MHNHEPDGSNQHLVLHIEHDEALRDIVHSALAPRADIRLVSASRGKLGLELARVHQPSVVLLDMGLPDIKGDVVLDCLRADPATRTASVIVISSEPAEGQIEQLVRAGELVYITKPLDANDFVDAIDKLLVARDPRSNSYHAFAAALPPAAAMAPSSVVSDMLHGALAATSRGVTEAHGLLELLMPL